MDAETIKWIIAAVFSAIGTSFYWWSKTYWPEHNRQLVAKDTFDQDMAKYVIDKMGGLVNGQFAELSARVEELGDEARLADAQFIATMNELIRQSVYDDKFMRKSREVIASDKVVSDAEDN